MYCRYIYDHLCFFLLLKYDLFTTIINWLKIDFWIGDNISNYNSLNLIVLSSYFNSLFILCMNENFKNAATINNMFSTTMSAIQTVWWKQHKEYTYILFGIRNASVKGTIASVQPK